MSQSRIVPGTIPSSNLLNLIKALGYDIELPTSMKMFYDEWDKMSASDRLDLLKLSAREFG
jgi:hypothetical protein